MFTPYSYQQEAIDETLAYLNKGGRRPVVVAPTASGKSVMIACFCQQVLARWSNLSFLVVSDNAEIIKQDYDAIVYQNPNIDVGLYCADLGRKTINQITVASIQSIYRKPQLFLDFHMIHWDEAQGVSFEPHMIARKFLDTMDKPTVGWTATPFRTKGGYLHTGEEAYFDGISYSIEIKTLQNADPPKLCQIRTKSSKHKMDTKGIKKQGGDFVLKELSLAFDRKEITRRIIKEVVQYRDERKKWLGFAIDVKHCEHITEELLSHKIAAKSLHSKIIKRKRKQIIEEYRAGEFQALVSVDMVIKGFDVKDIDLLFVMRSTESLNSHVQIPGRGMRVFPGKEDCLLLDFAGNLLRNGPIDNPPVEDSNGLKKKKGEPIMKECPKCLEIIHIGVRTCPACGHKFVFKHHLSSKASEEKVLSVSSWHKVEDVLYEEAKARKTGTPMLKVTYLCGLRRFSQMVCLEHPSKARMFAIRWWKRRLPNSNPPNVKNALSLVDRLDKPKQIFVKEKGKYPNITNFKF